MTRVEQRIERPVRPTGGEAIDFILRLCATALSPDPPCRRMPAGPIATDNDEED